MAKEEAATNNFPFNRLAELLKCSRKVCVVGYEFSWDSHLPHFDDNLKGVWSEISAKSRINPFTSANYYGVVLNWLDWRRQAIRKAAVTFEPFQILFKMQKDDPEFTIATQCVDGLINLNGFENAYELYGNVFQAICHDNGHEFSSWPRLETIEQRITCEICGSAIFPNITMFGWNKKTAVRARLLNQIEKAGVLILIEADKKLAPINEMDGEHFSKVPIIKLNKNGIVLTDGNVTYIASINAIEKNSGNKLSSPQDWSLTKTMRYLSPIQ